MADETLDFGVELTDDVSANARKMSTELDKLLASFRALERRRSILKGFARDEKDSLERVRQQRREALGLNKAYSAHAPLARAAGRALRFLGVDGASLRRITIDADKTEKALRRLYRMRGGGVSGAAAVAGAGLKRAGITAPNLARGAGRLAGGAVGALAPMAATGGLIVGGAALAGTAALGVSIARAAFEAERLRFGLDRITGGQGGLWFDRAAEYARRFGVNVNETAANLLQMKASGFSDDLTTTIFERTADLRALGATEESIGRALLAIRQIKAAGRLQGDELNQLGEAGIDASFIYAELSKKLGKSTAEIIKLKEAGKLSAEVVIPAIAAAMGTKTGGGAAGSAGEAAASSTVLGQWDRVKAAFSVASVRAIGGDALAPLRQSLGRFADWLSGSGGQAVADRFGGFLAGVFDKAPVVIDKVIWLLEVGLPEAWTAFKDAFTPASGLERFVATADSLGSDTGPSAIQTFQDIGAEAGRLADVLWSIVDAGAAFAGWVAKWGKYSGIGSFVEVKRDLAQRFGGESDKAPAIPRSGRDGLLEELSDPRFSHPGRNVAANDTDIPTTASGIQSTAAQLRGQASRATYQSIREGNKVSFGDVHVSVGEGATEEDGRMAGRGFMAEVRSQMDHYLQQDAYSGVG